MPVYVDGEKRSAVDKLHAEAVLNGPAELQRLAKEPAPVAEGPVTPAPAPQVLTADTDPKRVVGSVVESLDALRDKAWCTGIGGEASACSRVAGGTIFVTDVESVGNDCVGQFIAVAKGREVRVVLNGPFRVHGARILLNEGESLVVGQREGAPQKRVLPKVPAATVKKGVAAFEEPEQVLVETDPRRQCKLLWSGFQPYGAKVPPPDFGY